MRWFVQARARCGRFIAWPVAVLLTVMLSATPAFAHGGDESDKAGDLVRQAIALMVNTPDDQEMIQDKINDALASTDTEGVDESLVSKANEAFGRGDLHNARAFLEVSVGAQPHLTSAEVLPIRESAGQPGQDMFATGSESGTNVTTDGLSVRRSLDAGTWAALGGLAVLALVGVGLAIRYRPPVSMRALRAAALSKEG